MFTLLAADTPQGTVQRYLIALENQDYQQAYTYLSPNMPGTMSYNDWLTQNQKPSGNSNRLAGNPRQDRAKRRLCYSGGVD